MNMFEDMEAEDAEDLQVFEENEVEEGGQQDAAEENETADDSKKTVKPKRVVRNPQPKLNAETLKGKRGLVALESYFERVKFKGHGHEEEDLSVILKTYEYWCHRLFPKYPFDECISKIESLAKKKPVVTYIKRLRADLPYDYGPEIVNQNDDSENEDVTHNEFDHLSETPETQLPAQVTHNEFDHLLEAPETQLPAQLSEEQLERIRLNKERAEKIRREKLRQKELSEMLNEASGSQTVCSSSQHGETESLFEEAMSQIEFPEFEEEERRNNPDPENSISQDVARHDFEGNHISELETHNNYGKNDQVSDDESDNDLEITSHITEMEVQNDLEESHGSQSTVLQHKQNQQDVESPVSLD